jgi:hypothetical protein
MDLKAIETALASGLPGKARWLIDGTTLDFDFSVTSRGLRNLPDEAIPAADCQASDLLVFGEQDFSQGGGARPWLCISKTDGLVYGFDAEREQPIFLLNSSVNRFVATFHVLNEHLAKSEGLPPELEGLLHAIDPDAYPRSDWRLLVVHLRSA